MQSSSYDILLPISLYYLDGILARSVKHGLGNTILLVNVMKPDWVDLLTTEAWRHFETKSRACGFPDETHPGQGLIPLPEYSNDYCALADRGSEIDPKLFANIVLASLRKKSMQTKPKYSEILFRLSVYKKMFGPPQLPTSAPSKRLKLRPNCSLWSTSKKQICIPSSSLSEDECEESTNDEENSVDEEFQSQQDPSPIPPTLESLTPQEDDRSQHNLFQKLLGTRKPPLSALFKVTVINIAKHLIFTF